MATKRPAKKAPAKKAGAKPKLENKQRVTLLTTRERRASTSGGILDDRIPETAVAQRLTNEAGFSIEQANVVSVLRARVAWCRLMQSPESNRLEPREISQQALDTAAAAEELIARMEFMVPSLAGVADEKAFQAWGETVFEMETRMKDDLHRLIALMRDAARQIRAQPSKPGEKTTERKVARAEIAETLRAHSDPRLGQRAAKELADELLTLCGLPNRRRGSNTN